MWQRLIAIALIAAAAIGYHSPAWAAALDVPVAASEATTPATGPESAPASDAVATVSPYLWTVNLVVPGLGHLAMGEPIQGVAFLGGVAGSVALACAATAAANDVATKASDMEGWFALLLFPLLAPVMAVMLPLAIGATAAAVTIYGWAVIDGYTKNQRLVALDRPVDATFSPVLE